MTESPFPAAFVSMLNFGAFDLAAQTYPQEWAAWRERAERSALTSSARLMAHAKPRVDMQGRWRDVLGQYFNINRLHAAHVERIKALARADGILARQFDAL